MTPEKQVAKLERLIKTSLPGSSVSIDAPARPSGDWFVDVECDSQAFVIEYRPKLGFGLSSIPSDGYGEGPDEFLQDDRRLIERLVALVRERASTEPERARLLRDLRATRAVTQVELADRLGVRQPTVSKLERREDVNLATLRRYVEALGGQLHVTATFPEGTVELGLGESDPPRSQ